MRVAVVYYSMAGNAKYVADQIASNLKDKSEVDVIELVPEKAYPDKGAKKFLWGGKSAVMGETPKLKPYTFDASIYDVIILGTPVWASNCAPPMRTFLTEHKSELQKKKIGIYVCFSGGGAEKAVAKMKKCLDIEEIIAEMHLIDPKGKPDEKNEDIISEFCKSL